MVRQASLAMVVACAFGLCRPVHAGEPVAPMSKQAAEIYAQTDVMMRQVGDEIGDKMMKLLLPIARKEPHPLLIGRLVVAAARTAHGEQGIKRVDEMLAAAEANPDNALAQFIAGVAAHYRGHGHGKDRQAKSADYERTIKYLRRAEPTLGHAPRLWIYLAVSYVRTGQQQKAEDAIEQAKRAEKGEDADVHYCSAEVHHRTNPKKALEDIDRYIAIMAENRKKGAYTAPQKETAVLRMRAHLQQVIAGEAEPAGLELFDPVAQASMVPRGWGKWLLALILALLPALLVVLYKRTRRQVKA